MNMKEIDQKPEQFVSGWNLLVLTYVIKQI